jgi:hypothetical protein
MFEGCGFQSQLVQSDWRMAGRVAGNVSVLKLVQAGNLRTVIDRLCSREEIAEAHRHAEAWTEEGVILIGQPKTITADNQCHLNDIN